MSKVTLALGSFIVGACSTWLVLGSQSFGSQTPTTVQGRSTFKGGGVRHSNRGVGLEGSEPTFQSFLAFPKFDDCTFKDVSFEYAGGAYNLINCSFSGGTRVVLKGTAANTLSILPLLQAITSGHPPEPPKPQTPMLKTAKAQSPITINFTSPYSK